MAVVVGAGPIGLGIILAPNAHGIGYYARHM
ncbi:Uncharacterised protein [Gordonia terrae]|nr:Uncharacterised protein [Clostridioides difficile]VTS28859.1 Uncharacterised protein [Gordonia terrae]